MQIMYYASAGNYAQFNANSVFTGVDNKTIQQTRLQATFSYIIYDKCNIRTQVGILFCQH